MTIDEILLFLEDAYTKELTAKQREIYQQRLRRFNAEELETLYGKVLESCRYFPKVSDFFSCAEEAGFLSHSKKKRVSPASDCVLCKGTGWEYVTSYRSDNGEPYNSVRHCVCTGVSMPDSGAGAGPGGWIVEEKYP